MRHILTTDDTRLARAFAKIAPCYVVYDLSFGEWRVYLYEPYKVFWLISYLHDYVSKRYEEKIKGVYGDSIKFNGAVLFPNKPQVREYLIYVAYRLSMHQMVYQQTDEFGAPGIYVSTRMDYDSKEFWRVFWNDVISVIVEGFNWYVEW